MHKSRTQNLSIVTRFAPSPTGLLHLGHVHAALTAWRAARDAGGQFLLRLEDIDPGRCHAEFAVAIRDDLSWLGLHWDGEVRVQSDHLAEYARTLQWLEGRSLIYPCFCTRADIAASATAAHGAHLVYPGTCKRLSADERAARIAGGARFAQRLDMTRALDRLGPALGYEEVGIGTVVCRPERFGDVVLARKDAPASYHLCVTHDDALQSVTLVTRGCDLAPMTDVHRVLQALMGWPTPRYRHHRLVVDADGARLAKRDGAVSVRALRAAGWSAGEVLAAG